MDTASSRRNTSGSKLSNSAALSRKGLPAWASSHFANFFCADANKLEMLAIPKLSRKVSDRPSVIK